MFFIRYIVGCQFCMTGGVDEMIKKIEIKNFRSIKELIFDFRDVNKNIVCLLGKNGSGKSNITKAILYFWEHLCEEHSSISVCDSINPYNQTAEIAITFDISLLRNKATYNSKLNDDIEYIDEVFGHSEAVKSVTIKMIQNRKGNIFWQKCDKRVRKIIKSCFPVYYINTRALDIYTWEKIWSIISDISVTKPKLTETEMIASLNETFEKTFGSKYLEVEKAVSEIFDEQKITFDKYHFDSKYKSAFAMRFGGNKFQFDNMSLDFYSDGTNSYKYLMLFLKLVSKLHLFSSKYPIILLDEPEIGMHPNYIFEFVRCVCDCIPQNALLFMNTHSPELIKDIVKNISDRQNTEIISLYHVYYYRLYTLSKQMNLNFLLENKDIITLNETDCYFYDAIVYVEGKTEMQLFNNYYLRLLFPKLRQVCFYLSGSDDVNLKIVSVENINLGTNYKFLVDMDKIITYKKDKCLFEVKTKGWINPLSDERKIKKLEYRFYSKKSFQKKETLCSIKMLLKKNYTYKNGTHYIEEDDFNKMIKSIISYCQSDNVIVNWTTIEGELITYENIDKFISFLNTMNIHTDKKIQHDKICSISDHKEKCVLIMSELNGKTETQEGSKKDKVKFNGEDLICGLLNKKTSGWVSDWMEYYYKYFLEGKDDKRSVFQKDFPSLYKTLQIIESMV